MAKSQQEDYSIEELMALNQVDAVRNVVEMMRELIIKDDQISEETKKRFLLMYLQFRLHHFMLEKQSKEHIGFISKLYRRYFPKK